MDARIDENTRNILTAYNETTGLVERVRVDPILNAVLCFGVAPDANTPLDYDRAAIDENTRNTLSAYNESTGLVEAARCGTGGELLITE